MALTPFGWQRVSSIQLSLRIHDTSITAGTIVDPLGKAQWTAYGSQLVQTDATQRQHHVDVRGFELSGRVVDEHGGVAGIAVKVGDELVFTDSRGYFLTRKHKDKPLALAVDLDASVAPGNWKLVLCPWFVKAGTPAEITVRRAQ